MKPGIEFIREERIRQIMIEGWDEKHDDLHVAGELAAAASCYAKMAQLQALENWSFDEMSQIAMRSWPWAREWWKPHAEAQRNLEKAGALIASEIDRLIRLNNP